MLTQNLTQPSVKIGRIIRQGWLINLQALDTNNYERAFNSGYRVKATPQYLTYNVNGTLKYILGEGPLVEAFFNLISSDFGKRVLNSSKFVRVTIITVNGENTYKCESA